ncbi:hypothetical protein ANN_16327 [Periplaneta americana]|uniref:Uncharacterized protein n=1 Tax=Periplaneta americana TaxID=6978 RepID=A0ABQ8SIN3_PERAM|nr:hypothetical protein ANN_16327 [Periplaneta americana]
MACLCGGGNEPSGSLKAIYRQMSSLDFYQWCVDKLQGFYRVVLVLVADVSTAVLWSSSEQLLDKEAVESSATNTKTTR